MGSLSSSLNGLAVALSYLPSHEADLAKSLGLFCLIGIHYNGLLRVVIFVRAVFQLVQLLLDVVSLCQPVRTCLGFQLGRAVGGGEFCLMRC